jgi:trigger factor
MQIEKVIKKEPNAKLCIEITVDKSAVGEVRESVIRDYEKTAKIPGFRKGKVPREIILSRFSDGIKNKTIDLVLKRSLAQVLEEGNYKALSTPVITEMGDLITGENFSFKAECDLVPEIKLGDYKGVSSPRYTYDVDESLVNKELENLREKFATLVGVDKEAEIGDYLLIDYEEITENGKRVNGKENQTLLLDKEDDPLVKQLIGMKKGDEKEIELTSEYEQDGKKIAKTMKYHILLKEVKKKELPELNDDFAKDISDAENLEELKTKIRDELKEDAERIAIAKTKDEIISKIIANSSFEIPETLISSEIDRIINDIAKNYQIDIERIKEDQKKYEEHRKNLRPRALENIKYELTLIEVAKREGIEANDSEIDEEIMRYAQKQKKDFDQIKKQLEKYDSIETLRYRLTISKVLDFLYKNAVLSEEKHIPYNVEEEEV